MKTIDDKLQAVAAACVTTNRDGCDCVCGSCDYNVFNYTDTRTAGILMANARANYADWQEVKRKIQQDDLAFNLAPLIFIALIVAGIMWCCNKCAAPSQAVQMNESTTGRLTAMQQTAEVRYLLSHQNQPENIDRILKVMRSQGVRDVNRDGKINCIDNSITFYRLYGSDARIIINNNPLNGMNHMFIMVWYDSINTIHIEPQGEPGWYAMGVVWGMKYKPYFNKDVTSIWGGYVGEL